MRDFIDIVFSEEPKNFIPKLKELGFSGCVFVTGIKTPKELQELKTKYSKEKFPCYLGILIDPKKTKNLLSDVATAHKYANLVLLKGGDIDQNKAIARAKNADIILSPISIRKMNVDMQTISVCKDNKVRFSLNLNEFLMVESHHKSPDKVGILELILTSESFLRSELLGKYIFLANLLGKYKWLPMLFSGATKPEELRNPIDMACFMESLGYDYDQSLRAVSSLTKGMIE
ncbi:MAG: hypothetical protein JXA43_01730 [Candidatus Diapherotrites archaeon]|nr:hypothetical protein [Candidatus Diapherotrites archaeon]